MVFYLYNMQFWDGTISGKYAILRWYDIQIIYYLELILSLEKIYGLHAIPSGPLEIENVLVLVHVFKGFLVLCLFPSLIF